MKRSAAVALLALALAGCATTSPDVVSREGAQRLSSVEDAVVLHVRSITVEGSQTGLGAGSGAVVGGVAGASIGGQREAIAVGALGAVLGGVTGNVVERAATREAALEIVLRLASGERRAVVQAQGRDAFEIGEQVLLVHSAGTTRVTKAVPSGRRG